PARARARARRWLGVVAAEVPQRNRPGDRRLSVGSAFPPLRLPERRTTGIYAEIAFLWSESEEIWLKVYDRRADPALHEKSSARYHRLRCT
ncbi:hypothetical protein, partial [Thermanaerothrix sp.]|uniref:hypothetical protein n=1 Tax=Thermanaerothrix sp. TaxID=2972675 RepID=UPI002ADE5329